MTWKLTVRSNPGSTVTADYECPEHGRFEATVPRDTNGDPPDDVPCPVVEQRGGGVFVPLPLTIGVVCQQRSPYVMSAPGHVKVKAGEVVRGKSDARPPEHNVMDTSLIADGMPLDEFKRRRAAVHRDESLRRVRGALGRGPKVWSR